MATRGLRAFLIASQPIRNRQSGAGRAHEFRKEAARHGGAVAQVTEAQAQPTM
jgi:hypothetical protein